MRDGDELGQLFFVAMSGHAGPIQIDFGVTPVVCRISCGQAAALIKGRRACRTDLNVSSRAAFGLALRLGTLDECQAGIHSNFGNTVARQPSSRRELMQGACTNALEAVPKVERKARGVSGPAATLHDL
jgi:hypothetical protein